jgi:hypothetical protein
MLAGPKFHVLPFQLGYGVLWSPRSIQIAHREQCQTGSWPWVTLILRLHRIEPPVIKRTCLNMTPSHAPLWMPKHDLLTDLESDVLAIPWSSRIQSMGFQHSLLHYRGDSGVIQLMALSHTLLHAQECICFLAKEKWLPQIHSGQPH